MPKTGPPQHAPDFAIRCLQVIWTAKYRLLKISNFDQVVFCAVQITWKPCKNFQKLKIECYYSNTYTTYYISWIYFFHQILYFSEIQTNLSKHVPDFLPLQIWTFWHENPKIQTLHFLLCSLSSTKLNWKSSKDPKTFSSWLWNRCTHTFGRYEL